MNSPRTIPETQISPDKKIFQNSRKKILQTVKRGLSIGARTTNTQGDGLAKDFKQLFQVEEREKLLKVTRCAFSTKHGPIQGLLFISNIKVAFCSDKDIRFTTSDAGEFKEAPYKVIIDLAMIYTVTPSENVKDSSEKYLEVVTVDGHDLWFMKMENYQNTVKCVQEALHAVLNSYTTLPELE
ncbi:hypothetical protein ACHQM5_010287 [Ranunculus cassubicifolius]